MGIYFSIYDRESIVLSVHLSVLVSRYFLASFAAMLLQLQSRALVLHPQRTEHDPPGTRCHCRFRKRNIHKSSAAKEAKHKRSDKFCFTAAISGPLNISIPISILFFDSSLSHGTCLTGTCLTGTCLTGTCHWWGVVGALRDQN